MNSRLDTPEQGKQTVGQGLLRRLSGSHSLRSSGSMAIPGESIRDPYLVPISIKPRRHSPIDMTKLSRMSGVVEVRPGVLYQGMLLNGVPEGMGELVDINENELLYQGHFKNGFYHGRGTLYMNNTQVKDGIFEKNRLIEGRTIYRDGSMYIGQYHNGSHHGHGRFILPSGVWIEGKWDGGKPKGEFKIHVADGKKMETVYDFDHADDNTLYTVKILSDRIYYEDKYLMKNVQPVFLFYFNGDVYVGNTNGVYVPVGGDYYRMVERGYEKLVVGEGMPGLTLRDIKCNPVSLVKNISFVFGE